MGLELGAFPSGRALSRVRLSILFDCAIGLWVRFYPLPDFATRASRGIRGVAQLEKVQSHLPPLLGAIAGKVYPSRPMSTGWERAGDRCEHGGCSCQSIITYKGLQWGGRGLDTFI